MLRELTIWKRFQSEITELDLRVISEMDHGYYIDEHFKALAQILSTGVLPSRLDWEPREVLGLMSWEDFRAENYKFPERVYFCAVVLLAASETSLGDDNLFGQIDKMAVAIDSANFMDQGRVENLYEFFRYLAPRVKLNCVNEDFLYFKLSNLILASMLKQPADVLEQLIGEVICAERAVAVFCEYDLNSDIFSYTFFDQKIDLWRKYYAEFSGSLEAQRKKEFGAAWGFNANGGSSN